MMTRSILFGFVLMAVAAGAFAAETVDRIVAVVGSEIITSSDLGQVPKGGRKEPLAVMIDEILLRQEMGRLGIEVSDSELAEAIRSVLAQNRMTIEALKSELSGKGISFSQYKHQLSGQIRQMKFVSQVIVPRIRISETELQRKAGAQAGEEERNLARRRLLEERIPGEMDRYLEEVREKTYIDIKP